MTRHSSVLQDKKECYITHHTHNLQVHHCLNGRAQRKKCDEDGLWVYLTAEIHNYIHNTLEGRDVLIYLKQVAQRKYEETHSREEFIKRYGKSYIL